MVFKCKMCGGEIEVIEGTNTGKCLYCKSVMTLPISDNEKIINLYNRANDLRLDNEFDKAYTTYESILEIDEKQVEAHWGLVLCRYGVEYVDDPKTKKKVPTCHRTLVTSILSDKDYKYILKNAYGEALELYKKEAEQISEIQKGILEISAKEKPYDVFICYKETDDKGERTHDSVIAEDIYNDLTEAGYKVFFARITLEDKLGKEYEPYIYSALKSAKVMLVVGTTKENFEAVWVKNEWSRYLEFMKKDKSKSLIPVYSKIDAYRMPADFANLQAQCMDKIGAMQDLVRGVKKLIDEPKTTSDEDLEKRLEEASDGVKSLGNGKYEVTQVKEKLPTWYIIFVICLILILFEAKGANLSMEDAVAFYVYGDLFQPEFIEINIVVLISSLLVFLALLFRLISRKLFKISYIICYIVFVLDVITALLCIRHNAIISIGWIIAVICELLLYFVNPKWHIDASLKTIVNKEEKDKIQAKNNKIRNEFTFKVKNPIKFIFFLLGTVASILVYFAFAWNLLFTSQSNPIDDSKYQVKVLVDDLKIRDENFDVVGKVKKGDIYTVLDLNYHSFSNCSLWYKIKTNREISGYICGQTNYVEPLNPEVSVQANERDTSVKQLVVVNDFVNVRDDSKQNGDIVGVVYKDEIYTILDEEKNGSRTWYKIRTNNDIEGYIIDGDTSEKYVEILEAE